MKTLKQWWEEYFPLTPVSPAAQDAWHSCLIECGARIRELEGELAKERECVDFYASSDSWGSDRKGWSTYLTMDESDKGEGSFNLNKNTDDSGVGGRRARERQFARKEDK